MGAGFRVACAAAAASPSPLSGGGWAGRQAGSGEGQRNDAGCIRRRALSGTVAPLLRDFVPARPPSGATLPRKGGRGIALALFSCVLTTPAFAADDASSCAAGITMIRDALAANPPEAALPKLKKALRVAEREQKEGEFDECLDAVADARKVLAR